LRVYGTVESQFCRIRLPNGRGKARNCMSELRTVAILFRDRGGRQHLVALDDVVKAAKSKNGVAVLKTVTPETSSLRCYSAGTCR
jgi:hypothetical protein